jgi:hypothetical protein
MRHLLLVMFLFAGDALSFAAGSSDLLIAIRNGDHARVQKLLGSTLPDKVPAKAAK